MLEMDTHWHYRMLEPFIMKKLNGLERLYVSGKEKKYLKAKAKQLDSIEAFLILDYQARTSIPRATTAHEDEVSIIHSILENINIWVMDMEERTQEERDNKKKGK